MIVRAAESDGNPLDWERVRAVAGSTHRVTVVGAALAMAGRAGDEAPTCPARDRPTDTPATPPAQTPGNTLRRRSSTSPLAGTAGL
jgi:hypothetical protein